MKLRDIINHLDKPVISGSLDVEVAGLAYDSRRARKGILFAALRGTQGDGHAFIPQAIADGACAIVAETAPPVDCPVTWLHVRDSRAALADLAAAFNGYPTEKMIVGGVTGTNGKTTTAFLMHHLLNHAQLRCGLLGTVVYDVGGQLRASTHTTPESVELQGLFADMAKNGCRAAAIEVSSHALEQNRVRGVAFDTAVFTNLTQDHLDFHGTMEAYFKAKTKLFAMTAANPKSKLVINCDDKWGRMLLDEHRDFPGLITYGFTVPSHYRVTSPRYELTGTTFELEHKGRALLVRTPLIGQFNVYNAIAAIVASHAMGCNLRDSVRAMANAPQIPGRMERVSQDNNKFHVFVDYAHTPDGLVNALSTARALRPSRIITVFGCGGDRDRIKRPLMAQAVEEHSDVAILTSDNPRMEDPERILDDAAKGFRRPGYQRVADRQEAIWQAIQTAKPGDIVVIAGKGHESYQDIQGVKHPFDDRKWGRSLLDRFNRMKGEWRMEQRDLKVGL
ncbi:MAG: UDP-N-acetylmuramoyl-L-alanyl-D-glutamate--2,6-diaminopimelate ligase [Roseimicrobium sp.]